MLVPADRPEGRASALISPTEEEWRAMTPAQRLQVMVAINERLSDISILMSEGQRHKKAKGMAMDVLGRHFARIGRRVYLAEDLAVMYPGEEAFSPDVFAVLDVPQIEDDPRMAWVVVDEGRGPDFVLEVLHQGDRQKDLVKNVERYARHGIPEYFVYDRKYQRIHGYRLPDPSARRYQPVVGQAGQYSSRVLGVELAIVEGSLRFFYSTAELVGSGELIGRLEKIADDLEARALEAEAEAERARAEVERASAEAERAISGLRDGVLAVLVARGIAVSDAERARVVACSDAAVLQRWLARATTARSADEALSGQA